MSRGLWVRPVIRELMLFEVAARKELGKRGILPARVESIDETFGNAYSIFSRIAFDGGADFSALDDSSVGYVVGLLDLLERREEKRGVE